MHDLRLCSILLDISAYLIYTHIVMRETLNKDQTELLSKVKLAYTSLIHYRKLLLQNGSGEVAPASFHTDWSDILLHGIDNFAIEAFRQSAKGQYVLRSFPLYSLTFPDESRDYIALVKANSDQAQAKLKEISREYHSNPAISANKLKTIEDSAKALCVEVLGPNGKVTTVRIEAYGKGSAIRGLSYLDRRPKIVIMDDIQDAEDARSNKIMDDDWDQFLSDIKFLGKDTRIFMIGNNLGERCIVERILSQPELLNFKTKRIGSWAEDEKGMKYATWPEQFDLEFLENELEQYRKLGKTSIWMRERQCLSMAPESAMAQPGDLRTYMWRCAKTIASKCNIYIRMDPAFSERETADYTVIFIFGIDDLGNWHIFDIRFGHWNLQRKLDEIFLAAREWNPRNYGIENVGGQKMLIEMVQKEMSIRNCFFRLIELKPGGRSKSERISLLQPLFKSNRVHVPTEASWLKEFEGELYMTDGAGNCKAAHDDVLDAMAYGINETTKPIRTDIRGNKKNNIQRHTNIRTVI